ncbi:hypothetical protein HDU92_007758 [Lobulomyces angularis]|nr:hypothetical protein HDU92_007758 [Lobulomyces angularis]
MTFSPMNKIEEITKNVATSIIGSMIKTGAITLKDNHAGKEHRKIASEILNELLNIRSVDNIKPLLSSEQFKCIICCEKGNKKNACSHETIYCGVHRGAWNSVHNMHTFMAPRLKYLEIDDNVVNELNQSTIYDMGLKINLPDECSLFIFQSIDSVIPDNFINQQFLLCYVGKTKGMVVSRISKRSNKNIIAGINDELSKEFAKYMRIPHITMNEAIVHGTKRTEATTSGKSKKEGNLCYPSQDGEEIIKLISKSK